MNAQEIAETALLTRTAMLTCCESAGHEVVARMGTEVSDRALALATIRQAIADADVVVWQRSMWERAINGWDRVAGRNVRLPQSKPAPQLWYLDEFSVTNNAAAKAELNVPTAASIRAIVVIPFKQSLVFAVSFSALNEPIPVPYFRFFSVADGDTLVDAAAPFICCWKFLDTTVPVQHEIKPPRSTRRRMERAGSVVPPVRIIQLREAERIEHTTQRTGRKLKNRHIRTGHWMCLSEPLKRDSIISGGVAGDEIVWRRATIVGPDSAPLLPPRESVYVVAR